jgi:2-methylfumaryl-CoA hydratase
VRTTGTNQHGGTVLDYVRWVMVRKRDAEAPAPETVIPTLPPAVAAADLAIPRGLDFTAYDFALAGEPHRWGDYAVGEIIDHVDGVTVEEAEHMLATRLWQNTAKVHFDANLARGRAAADLWRACHQPGARAFLQRAGERADDRRAQRRQPRQPVLRRRHRPRLVRGAGQGRNPRARRRRAAPAAGRHQGRAGALRDADGRYLPEVLLDLDYWALIPT